jgi:hypothetical protein
MKRLLSFSLTCALLVLSALMATALSTAPAFAAAATVANPGNGARAQQSVPAIVAPVSIPQKISAVGQGTGLDSASACPDITCGSGSCICLTGSGSLIGIGVGKSSFSYELSVDASAPLPNGGFASNYASSGFVTITLPGNTGAAIDLLIQGNTSDTAFPVGLAGFTGSFIANGGTGAWSTARGAGNCSLSLDFVNTGNTTITLNGGLAKK